MGQAVEPPSLGRWHRPAGAVAPPLYTHRRWNRLAGVVASPQSPVWSSSTAC
ncbi:unnamed protein product, partial [Musa textilis]